MSLWEKKSISNQTFKQSPKNGNNLCLFKDNQQFTTWPNNNMNTQEQVKLQVICDHAAT